jgi:malonyl CoA-acyl carrier protein transacylase
MSTACAAADGAMAAVQSTREELLARLDGVGGVVLANHNAPLQSVISGEKQAVRQVVDALNVAEIMARMLPVAGAFHSSLVASAQVSLSGAIAAAPMQTPKIPVYANSTARPYASKIDAIRKQLSEHLLSPVEFVGQINAMYAAGARTFIEVGPKSILTKLVSQILTDKNHTVVSLDGQGGGLRGFLLALGTLVTRSAGIKLTALFEGRDVQSLDLSRLVALTRKPELSRTTWLVNGGNVRPHNQAVGYTGQIPPLTLETATQAKRETKDEGSHNLSVMKSDHSPVPPAPTPTSTPVPSAPTPTSTSVPSAPTPTSTPVASASTPTSTPVAPTPSPNFAIQSKKPLPMSTPQNGAPQPAVPSTSCLPRNDASILAATGTGYATVSRWQSSAANYPASSSRRTCTQKTCVSTESV